MQSPACPRFANPAFFVLASLLLFTHRIQGDPLRETPNATSKNTEEINIKRLQLAINVNEASSLLDIRGLKKEIFAEATTLMQKRRNTSLNNYYASPSETGDNFHKSFPESRAEIPIDENAVKKRRLWSGRRREGDSSATGRQLTDITAEAAARKPQMETVKNGIRKRDVEGSGKETPTELFAASGKKVEYDNIDPAPLGGFNILSIDGDEKSERSAKLQGAWADTPLPLISDDCSEMKTNIASKPVVYKDLDMEFSDKDKHLHKKVTILHSDPSLKTTSGISHAHGLDKERRAISDAKASAYRSSAEKAEEKQQNFANSHDVLKELKSMAESLRFESRETSVSGEDAQGSRINAATLPPDPSAKSIDSNSYDYLRKKIPASKINNMDEDDMMDNFDKDDNEGDSEITDDIAASSKNASLEQDEQWFAWRGRDRDGDTVIRFGSVLPSEKYIVPGLRLAEGPFLFRFLATLFSFLHPYDFPTELLRDVMWNKLSVPQLILQSLRVEAGFIACITLMVFLALVVPAYGMCAAALALAGRGGRSCSPPPGPAGEGGPGACARRACLLLMQLLLVMLVAGVAVMVAGNEASHSGAARLGPLLGAAARDARSFVLGAHSQLARVLLDAADQSVAAAEHDLDRVDILLGEPIQKALAAETGIDVALESLNDITLASTEMSRKVSSLGTEGSRAATLAASARDRLRELRRQLEAARRNCALRDRPLCETIDSTGVEIIINFDMVSEQRLEKLAEALNARNLSEAADEAKKQFADIPRAVKNQTSPVIEDVRHALTDRRAELRTAERALAKVARHLSSAIGSSSVHVDGVVRAIDAIEFWRWLLFLVAILLMCLVILLLVSAVSCGCCGAEKQASGLLKTSVILMCLFSIPLWILSVVVFVVGGHGEVFFCRPLYDEPEYKVIGKLLDKPGLLYKDGSSFFQELFKEINYNNLTMDVPMRDILRECKQNKPAYPVFRLQRVADLNLETAHFNWTSLAAASGRLAAHAPAPASSLAAPRAHQALQDIMRWTTLNLTDYRLQLNGPITGKDLSSLGDQLESIANQMTDLSTSSRIETLASRTRRLVANTLHPLEQLRTDLVFRLTELELHVQPFQRQMNQSLSHLKTIQYYIDNQGAIIAEKKTQEYVKRLVGYLEQYRGHVLEQAEHHLAPCGPLWEIYRSGRSLMCRHYFDSLNGFWLGLLGCLVLWMGTAPVALRLRRACRAARHRRKGLLLRTITHHDPPQNDNWR